MQTAIGIDIGGTSTKLAAANTEGQILAKNAFPTNRKDGESSFFHSLFNAVSSLLEDVAEPFDLIGIGIAAPSCLPKEGIIKQAANLPFSEEVEIVHVLQNKYGVPVSLMKDANAAALGEGLFGAAKKMENYIVLTLGTGFGCGIVINNEIVAGNKGQAGEWGHSMIEENGRDCGCGKKGCLETYVSATGIKRTLIQLLALSTEDSVFRIIPFNSISPKMIYEAAQGGDILATKAFDHTGRILGRKLSELVALFEPEAIFLAGGLAEAKELLFRPAIEMMEKCMLDLYKGNVKVLPSSLKTNEAAMLGSASLVWKKSKVNTPCQLM